MNMQRFKGLLGIGATIFLLWGQPAFSSDIRIDVLGDVVGKGVTEMKAAFNKWISISGKAYPVIDGVNLRSKDGTMSLIFRDGTRMEVGRDSDIVINGSKGSYTIAMAGGKIAFTVSQGVSFSVETPNSTIHTESTSPVIRNVSFGLRENTRGVVSYDGKGTQVTVVSGALIVKDNAGAGIRTVAAGKAIYISGDGGRVTLAQLADSKPKGNPGNPGNPGILPLAVLGGAVLVEGGTYLMVHDGEGEGEGYEGVPSPSSP